MQSDNRDISSKVSSEDKNAPAVLAVENSGFTNDGLRGLDVMATNDEIQSDSMEDTTTPEADDGIWLPHPNWLRPADEESEDYDEEQQ